MIKRLFRCEGCKLIFDMRGKAIEHAKTHGGDYPVVSVLKCDFEIEKVVHGLRDFGEIQSGHVSLSKAQASKVETSYCENKYTVRLRRSTTERLKMLGEMGESYDKVINRIIDKLGEDK